MKHYASQEDMDEDFERLMDLQQQEERIKEEIRDLEDKLEEVQEEIKEISG